MAPTSFQPAAPSSGSLLLVGTRETVAQTAAALRASPCPPALVGCVLLRCAADAPAAIEGVPVLGAASSVAALHASHGFSSALLCVPSACKPQADATALTLTRCGVTVRRLVPVLDALFGAQPSSSPSSPQPTASGLDPQRLLGRPDRPMDTGAARSVITGKRVLLTGAGGSIGSELARIVASFEPASLVLLERSEHALFEIDRELASRFPTAPRRALLQDAVDAAGVSRAMRSHNPQTVFHAAAHKHVPMLEDHPAQALDNNLFGARTVADAAADVGAERFVLVSTDKAVNPSSVMGATKRLAELAVCAKNGSCSTRFSAVRFGNVLGSSGSVLTIWAKQLASRVPLTVTDPRMTRYFMTIPEAAALVVQAAALLRPGAGRRIASVFVLDMGSPVRIVDLARQYVRAHGLEPLGPSGARPAPCKDHPAAVGHAEIVCTGVRPGEKLHEELAYADEELAPTPINGVRAWRGDAPDAAAVDAMLSALTPLRSEAASARVVEALRHWLPSFAPQRNAGPVAGPSPPAQLTFTKQTSP